VAKRDGRTQAPTQKKKSDARKEGRIAKSKEMPLAAEFLAVTAASVAFMPKALSTTAEQMRLIFGGLDPTRGVGGGANLHTVSTLVLAWLPIVLVASAAGMVATLAQGGVKLAPKSGRPSLKNMSLKRGFGQLAPKQALPVLVRSVGKIGVIGYAAVGPIEKLWGSLAAGKRIPETAGAVGDALTTYAWRVVIGMLAISAFDYVIAKRKLRRDLMMTKQEVIDEMRTTEGNPRIKAMRRRRAYEISRRRSLSDVALADVIITNPTHFAVALAYTPGSPAPRVIAKGMNRAAARIRKQGARNGVPLMENRMLARALYRQCKLGSYVPQKLFDDVVKVLVAAYHRSGRFPRHLLGEERAA
jgi:flagellar biosynthetic protein FlhB